MQVPKVLGRLSLLPLMLALTMLVLAFAPARTSAAPIPTLTQPQIIVSPQSGPAGTPVTIQVNPLVPFPAAGNASIYFGGVFVATSAINNAGIFSNGAGGHEVIVQVPSGLSGATTISVVQLQGNITYNATAQFTVTGASQNDTLTLSTNSAVCGTQIAYSTLSTTPFLGSEEVDVYLQSVSGNPATFFTQVGSIISSGGGIVNGSFLLPCNAPPGQYTVRAVAFANNNRFATATLTVLPVASTATATVTATATATPTGTVTPPTNNVLLLDTYYAYPGQVIHATSSANFDSQPVDVYLDPISGYGYASVLLGTFTPVNGALTNVAITIPGGTPYGYYRVRAAGRNGQTAISATLYVYYFNGGYNPGPCGNNQTACCYGNMQNCGNGTCNPNTTPYTYGCNPCTPNNYNGCNTCTNGLNCSPQCIYGNVNCLPCAGTGCNYTLQLPQYTYVSQIVTVTVCTGFLINEPVLFQLGSFNNNQFNTLPGSYQPIYPGQQGNCFTYTYVAPFAPGNYFLKAVGQRSGYTSYGQLQISTLGAGATTANGANASAAHVAAASFSPLLTTPGQTVQLQGTGFAPNAAVTISGLGAQQTATASASGALSASVVVPAGVAVGAHLVTAQDSAGNKTTAGVQVTSPELASAPASSATSQGQAVAAPGTVPFGQLPTAPRVAVGALPLVKSLPSTTYFAAGSTGSLLTNGLVTSQEALHLFNSGTSATTVTTSYAVFNPATGARSTVVKTDSIAAGSTLRRSVNTDVGANREVSIAVSSTAGVVAELVITRAKADGSVLNTASSLGTSAPSRNWYLAEGYAGQSIQEYLTLFNPSSSAATVQLQYLPDGATAPAAQKLVIPANAQLTVDVSKSYGTTGKGLAVLVNADRGIVVDRSMYWGVGADRAKYGFSLAPAIASGKTSQYFAFLPTSNGSESYVTVFNPGNLGASVSLRLQDAAGSTLKTLNARVGALGRTTFAVSSQLRGSAVASGIVTSTLPVVAEASLYFGSPNGANAAGMLVQGTAGTLIGAQAALASNGGQLYLYNPSSVLIRVQVQVGSANGLKVVFEETISAHATKAIKLSGTTSASGVLVRATGAFSATLVNSGLNAATGWGTALS